MDLSGDFLAGFRQWLAPLDEAYLIGISNRGLYNRAIKDLESGGQVRVEVGADGINCALPDGNSCKLVPDVNKLQCSCPSRSICKHVLMALIYLQQHPGLLGPPAGGGTLPAGPPDFGRILNVSLRELKKLAGDSALNDIRLRLEFGIRAEIEAGSLLTVNFVEEGISVRFPSADPLNSSICSCKARNFCRHRAEAVVRYQLSQGRLKPEDLTGDATVEVSGYVLENVLRAVEEILSLGLARLPETTQERLEQLAVICHSADLPKLEKLLRQIQTEVKLYFTKSAGFSRARVRSNLSRAYLLLLAMQKAGGRVGLDLAGEHRSAYFDIPPIEIWGAGAEAWNSKAGYEGITYYFYSPALRRWLTFTSSRPTFYEGAKVNQARMYKASPPWGIEGTSEEFSKSRIKLTGGKINSAGRLSGGEGSQGILTGQTDPLQLNLEGPAFDDWELLLAKLVENTAYGAAERDENSNLFICGLASWGPARFDEIKQLFTVPLYDRNNRQISISLPYSRYSKGLTEMLEELLKQGTQPKGLLAKAYIRDGLLSVQPIAAYLPDGRIVNLTLD